VIKIQLKFHGGAREVGRSCFSLESGGFSLMLDCGVKLREEDGCPLLPDHTDALILSHAHLDHSGMIPALHREKNPQIYATDLTFELSHLLQRDSVKINKLRRQTHIYSNEDIDYMLGSEINTPYEKKRKLTGEISFRLMDAGHIPGSSSILLEIGGKRVFYTGDIKTTDTKLQKGASVPKADILIMEATYGDRIHPDRKEMEREFLTLVEETLDRGGNAIVPAFAVGRTQEVLMILKDIPYPIYLDGMGQKVTSIFLQYPQYIRDIDLLQRVANNAIWVENNSERNRAMSEPSVIVTTAGMVNGGPVMQYIHRLHFDKMSSILLTGYQVEGTNGRLLMEKGYVIDSFTNTRIPIKMQKHQFDLSAHAGRHSLERIAKKVNPEEAFVVHGDPLPCKSLGEFLSGICEAHIPEIGNTIEL